MSERVRMSLKRIKKAAGILGNLLFPMKCPVCDNILNDQISMLRGRVPVGICYKCAKTVHYIVPPRCFKCGKQLQDGAEEYCTDCRDAEHVFIMGRALYEYHSIKGALFRFKYGGRREYSKVFAKEVVFYLGDFVRRVQPDGLIPVPIHTLRCLKRGYNQAGELAKAIGREFDIPVYDKLVVRKINTKPLKNMSPVERQNSLKKAFILGENVVKLSTVIIIDDIYTTGATIDAVAKVLLTLGPMKIYFVTLAIGEGI